MAIPIKGPVDPLAPKPVVNKAKPGVGLLAANRSQFQGVQTAQPTQPVPNPPAQPVFDISKQSFAGQQQMNSGSQGAGAVARPGVVGSGGDYSLGAYKSGAITPEQREKDRLQAEKDAPTEIEKFYQDMLGQQDTAWQGQQQALQGEMAAFGREADSLNARMGGSIAGGYAGLAGSALGSGMKAYSEAANDYQQQRSDTMMKWMDQKLQDRNRAEDRTWTVEDRDTQNKIDMLGLQLQYGDQPGAGQYVADAMGNKDDGTPYNPVAEQRIKNISAWQTELSNLQSNPPKLKSNSLDDQADYRIALNKYKEKMKELERKITQSKDDIASNRERR
jgi:hypothetical protein